MGLALSAALVGWPLVCGCQSGAQSDLVARELRMQEDQIYAMEDYLGQYQRLLRQCRAENAALRQQVQTGRGADESVGPAFPERDMGGGDVTEPVAPPVEIPELRLPGTEESPPDSERSALKPSNPAASSGGAAFAADVLWPFVDENSSVEDAPLADDAPIANDLPPAKKLPPADSPHPKRVWLHGEVMSNEAGGPRLSVVVEPLSDVGRPAPFAGPLSLMVLTAGETGPPRSIARWDFSPSQARSAAAESDGNAMQFRLELPADTPVDGPFELWVRLLNGDGEKLLAHAPLDLQQLGEFSSTPFEAASQRRPTEQRAVRVVDQGVRERRAQVHTMGTAADSGWTVAQPGRPAGPSRDASSRGGTWRATTEPLPIAVAKSIERPLARQSPASIPPAPDAQYAVQQAAHHETAETSNPAPRRVISPPIWSPTR